MLEAWSGPHTPVFGIGKLGKAQSLNPVRTNKHMSNGYLLIKNLIVPGDVAGEQLKTQTFLLRFKPGGKNTNNCSAK